VRQTGVNRIGGGYWDGMVADMETLIVERCTLGGCGRSIPNVEKGEKGRGKGANMRKEMASNRR